MGGLRDSVKSEKSSWGVGIPQLGEGLLNRVREAFFLAK